MFMLQAPYPSLQTASILPNPQFSDQEALLGTVSRKLAVDGTRYTYIKRRGRRKLLWTFRLSREKALEVREFLFTYFASKIRITDHKGQAWLGYFTSNPFEFESQGRAAPAISANSRGEIQTVSLEFEGETV